MEHGALPLISLLSLTSTALPRGIARRLGVRVRSDMRLRHMLCEFLNGTRPGSDHSMLCGASEQELRTLRLRLVTELTAAIREVAAGADAPWALGLGRLAREIDACMACVPSDGEGTEILEEWIAISRLAGTTELEFLQICQ